jgi:Fur family iron response transcriptional regulator
MGKAGGVCNPRAIPDAKRLQQAVKSAYDYICNNLGLEPGSPGIGNMTAPRTIVFSTPTEALAGHPASHTQRPADLTGCPWHDVKSMLRDVGLRPTRQRMALGWILFAKGDRHLTAEMLYEEASKAKVPVSLATVYNTLHQFTDVGLLRQVAVDGSKTYFDTNASEHHHFFVEGENELVDIPGADVIVDKMPVAPEGYEIARIDVVVRLKKADKRR